MRTVVRPGGELDPTILDVEHPVVLPGDRPGMSLWREDHPAALLVAALSRPGMAVLAKGLPDHRLPVLAALLGADVTILTEDPDQVARAARINGVTVQSLASWPADADLVILPEPAGCELPGALMLCWRAVDMPGFLRLDVHGMEVVVSQQAEHDVPHLLMPAERAEEVLALVKVAVGELGRARTPGMAAHALASALRLVHEVEAESQRERATAVARVERAYEQMEQAREELRGIRHSRSWRYTRLLRRVTDR